MLKRDVLATNSTAKSRKRLALTLCARLLPSVISILQAYGGSWLTHPIANAETEKSSRRPFCIPKTPKYIATAPALQYIVFLDIKPTVKQKYGDTESKRKGDSHNTLLALYLQMYLCMYIYIYTNSKNQTSINSVKEKSLNLERRPLEKICTSQCLP